MSSQTKPLYEIQRKLQYKKHLQRLESISKVRSKRVLDKDPVKQMHKVRNQSMHFHNQRHVELLNFENDKIINKLMHIAKKKSNSFFKQEQPKMIYYENPARKRLKMQIQKNNITLAERILSKHSQFQMSNQRKLIDEYVKTKKMLQRNKRATLPQLQQLTHSRSTDKIVHKQTAYITVDNNQS